MIYYDQYGQTIDRKQHILNNVNKILTTPRGANPVSRAVGVDILGYVDSVSEGDALLITGVLHLAIKQFEPRIKINQIKVRQQENKMLIKLNWNTDDDQQKYNSEMTL